MFATRFRLWYLVLTGSSPSNTTTNGSVTRTFTIRYKRRSDQARHSTEGLVHLVHDDREAQYDLLRRSQQRERACWGLYAPPSACLSHLRAMVEGAKAAGIKNDPFDPHTPKRAAERRQSENSVNNYIEQSLHAAEQTMGALIDIAPLAFATPAEIANGTSVGEIRQRARDRAKRYVEAFDDNRRKS